MALQILSYEFLGPIKLSEWGPPMDKVVYLLLRHNKGSFQIIYAGELEKTTEANFFTKNEKFQCWLQNAGTEDNLYLSIYPMWDSKPHDRQNLLQKIIATFQPICNEEKSNDGQNK